jgi:hypothetical protein
MGEWRYISTTLDLGVRWRCGELYTLDIYPRGKRAAIPIG